MSYPVSPLTTQNIVNAAPSTNENKQRNKPVNNKLMGVINAIDKQSEQSDKYFNVERRSGVDRRNNNLIKSAKLDSRNSNDRRASAISIQI